MSLQSSLFGAPLAAAPPPAAPLAAAPPPAAPLDARILPLLAAAERTADQLAASLGLPVGDVLAELGALLDRRAVRSAPDGAWFLPWGSPETSCDSCRPYPDTLLCSCGHAKEAR